MKKTIYILFIIFLTIYNYVYADYGDVYFCNTTKISQHTKDEVKSNYKSIAFKMTMEKNSDHLGFIKFSNDASGTIVNDMGIGLLIDTHVKPEQFMASFGMTKAWFFGNDLFISSVHHDEENLIKRVIISFSKCDKF